MKRFFIVSAVALACASCPVSQAGAFITEPDFYVSSSNRSMTQDGNLISSVPRWSAGNSRGGAFSTTSGSAGDMFSRTSFSVSYLGVFDLTMTPPFTPGDEIHIELEAWADTGSGFGSRLVSASSQTFASFEITEPATVDLSGILSAALDASGGIRTAQVNIAFREFGSPFRLFEFAADNENIPNTVVWNEVLEPGLYSIEIGLSSIASANGTGDQASSILYADLMLSFQEIPAPGALALLGPVCVLAGRRRR